MGRTRFPPYRSPWHMEDNGRNKPDAEPGANPVAASGLLRPLSSMCPWRAERWKAYPSHRLCVTAAVISGSLKLIMMSWLSIIVGKRARAESLAWESFQAEHPLASADAARNKVCLMSLSFREYASGSRGNFSVNFSATGSRLLNFT